MVYIWPYWPKLTWRGHGESDGDPDGEGREVRLRPADRPRTPSRWRSPSIRSRRYGSDLWSVEEGGWGRGQGTKVRRRGSFGSQEVRDLQLALKELRIPEKRRAAYCQ
jgi:hypothetical protein